MSDKFIDEIVIYAKGGHGGPGASSFWREKFVALGGPDGGNGGKGGSITIVGDDSKTTLLDFYYRRKWFAQDGEKGEGSRRDGKFGEDLEIPVPLGTQIYKIGQGDELVPSENPELVADITEPGQKVVIVKGGRGGKGNDFFKSPTNRAPEKFQPGEEGEDGWFRLSLKLLADAGLIGLPNAGKSTLLSVISAAKPKIAAYPFTTLSPNLGVVSHGGKSFIVADIPGLIEGASEGKGLGTAFLKHIERTKILVHLVAAPLDMDPETNWLEQFLAEYDEVVTELGNFNEDLLNKPTVVVLSKVDLLTVDNQAVVLNALKEHCKKEVYKLSSATTEGVEQIKSIIAERLAKS